MTSWFDVDKEGLAKLLERKGGKTFALAELVSNAWDTGARSVEVTLAPVPARPLVEVVVHDDDPDGFRDIRHAFTLFAESSRKRDPEKRGRFNLGEKLVLAICEEATISTTTGTLSFSRGGRAWQPRKKRETGSEFRGLVRMTRAELEQAVGDLREFLPPDGIKTSVNGAVVARPPKLAQFQCALPTEVTDDDGRLRRAARETTVRVYECASSPPKLYEMGIPVVELSHGERWHVEVLQKVPLTMDRENVTPAFLRALSVHLANHCQELLNKEQARAAWVQLATEDDRCESAAIERVLDLRFGKKRAVFDPSEPESNKAALADGYTVVPGGALSGAQWTNVKRFGLAMPAGQVIPVRVQYAAEGRPERVVPSSEWSPRMRRIEEYAVRFADVLLNVALEVEYIVEPIRRGVRDAASWRCGSDGWPSRLVFNLGTLGKAWPEKVTNEELDDLLLHEMAHEYVSDHLTYEFSEWTTRLGAKLAAAIRARKVQPLDVESDLG